jgi:hypothetical protein
LYLFPWRALVACLAASALVAYLFLRSTRAWRLPVVVVPPDGRPGPRDTGGSGGRRARHLDTALRAPGGAAWAAQDPWVRAPDATEGSDLVSAPEGTRVETTSERTAPATGSPSASPSVSPSASSSASAAP